MRRVLLALFALSLLPLPWSSTAQAQDIQYQVIDLIQAHKDPAFVAQGSGAVAINDNGVIVGFTGESEIKSSPFYTVDGKPTRVKTSEFGATFTDINSNGVIVGREVTGRTDTGSPIGVPASWTDEEITRLEIPADPNDGTFVSGRALGINDSGEIVGELTFSGDDNRHVVVWAGGTVTILPPAYGYPYCEGPGITETGTIGGTCWNPDAQSHQPVIWTAGRASAIAAPVGFGTIVTAISDAPDQFALVGGNYDDGEDANQSLAVIFTALGIETLQGPSELPACMAETVAVTDAGLLVGGACAPTIADLNVNLETTAAVAWLDGELIDLNAATGNNGAWTFIFISAVNAEGQMVGYGERNGERRSFLLTPV